MKKLNILIATMIFLLLCRKAIVMAAPGEWTVSLTVSTPYSTVPGGVVFNALSAGIRNGATDGYDNAYDTVSLLEPDDPVQAYFPHGTTLNDSNGDGIPEGWGCPNPEIGYSIYQCSLWRDFRALSEGKTWSIEVTSPINGATISLSWRIDSDPTTLAMIDLTLIDLSASPPQPPMDIKLPSNYQYTNIFTSGKNYGLRRFEIRMKAKGLFITPLTLPDATIGRLYIVRLSAVGGSPVWSVVNGVLPQGMSINPTTGEITGIPVIPGSSTFTIRGDDPVNGYSGSREYTLNINSSPEINVTSLPEGILGQDYHAEILVAGGSAPIMWTIKGSLPEGLTLDSKRGVISGTTIIPGTYDFTATVTDANGATDSKEFQIKVIEPMDVNQPEAISDLRWTYATDTTILLTWSAPVDDSIIRTAALYDLRYIVDCPDVSGLDEVTWDQAIEASGEPRPIAGAIQTYTLSGLTPDKSYCIAIKSIDASGHVSSISNIVMATLSSATGTSGSSELTSSIALRKGYNLLSLPVIPIPNDRDSLFGPAVGTPVSLYRWYSAYPGITPPQYYLEDVVQPGLGYFLHSPSDDINLIIKGLEIENTEYSITLQSGWNMIGTPYVKTIQLGDILVKSGTSGEIRPYIDAVKAGWIGNTLYWLRDGNYDFASFNDDTPAALEPWVGYWIYVSNDGGVEIIFRKP